MVRWVHSYLTPRESTAEILDSLKLSPNPDSDRSRIFRLQWQDFIQASGATLPTGEPLIDMIFGDVQEFLRSRGLEYFAGFQRIAPLPELRVKRACFKRLRALTEASKYLAVIPFRR